MSFKLPELSYAYDALTPYIDSKTMEIHHGKHHGAYVSKLNDAIQGTAMEDKSLDDLMKDYTDNVAVRNNGGGHWNHSLFWKVMKPNAGGTPKGDIATAIEASFGSFEMFRENFSNAATTRFGSGWAWLIQTREGKLEVTSTPNQDNPLMPQADMQGTPLLGLDVWEHAYYLNYQNRRPDYIQAFFNVICWEEVDSRFKK